VRSSRDRLTQANAYYRVGDLELYLENFEEGVGPLEKSVDLTRRLRQEFPSEAAYHEALADRSLDLGHAYRELQDFNKAEATFREVLSLLEQIPDGETKADRLVTCKLEHAEVMQRQGRLDEALRLMVELRDQLLKANPTGTYYPLSLIDCRYRIASILLDQDQLSEAEKAHEEAHSQCRGMRGLVYEDSRSLLRGEMDLLVQCGDIAARQGELENAIAHYRESLELQRESFKEQRTPEQFNNAKFAGEVSSEPEPGPFARYVETQLRLADVLRRAGRPYDAEMELGSCEYVTRVLVGVSRPNALRYRILQANVWATAAHLAASQDRTDEVEGPRRIAARIWLDALEEFPHAADYTSGVHGRHSDFDWFRKSFPGELTENAATPDEADNFRDTPFGRRATAATAFRREDWQGALGEFARSAQVRSEDQAYDWLHVALCRGRMGHAVQAKSIYETAAAEIATMENAPADLLHLADQAKQLVDKLPIPKSYYKFDRVFVEPDAYGLAAARQIRIGPDGNVYVASHDTDVVKVFDPDTGELLRDIGTSGGELDGPWAMVLGPDSKLYVSGRWSRNVVRFDPNSGDYHVLVASKSGGLGAPRGIAIGPDGNLYLSSHGENTPYSTDTVKRFNGVTGAYMGDFVTVGSGDLNSANGIAFGPDGNLYVASGQSNAINVYDGATGEFLKELLSGDAAGVRRPSQVEFRDDGLLYVACEPTGEIKRFDMKTGVFVDIVFPEGLEWFELVGISGLAFDSHGHLYVSGGTAINRKGSRILRYSNFQHGSDKDLEFKRN
jgi:tetratricopeptide (TPR) repeat protein/sugar lactone lactonase YvrE